MNKKELLKRFTDNFKADGLRLLAIQLNGFSHKVFYDRGSSSDVVEVAEWSAYANSTETSTFRNYKIAAAVVADIPHYCYQGAPLEIVYTKPTDR